MFIKQILLPILFFICLPLIIKLLVRLRFGFVLLYVVIANTVFFAWTSENADLSDGIFIALITLTILSWVITFVRKSLTYAGEKRIERGNEALIVAQLRKARQDGYSNEDISIVSMDGLPIVQIK